MRCLADVLHNLQFQLVVRARPLKHDTQLACQILTQRDTQMQKNADQGDNGLQMDICICLAGSIYSGKSHGDSMLIANAGTCF